MANQLGQGWRSQLTESVDTDETQEGWKSKLTDETQEGWKSQLTDETLEDGEFEDSLKEISKITQSITEELGALRKLVEDSTASLLEIGMMVTAPLDNGDMVISPSEKGNMVTENNNTTLNFHGNTSSSTDSCLNAPASQTNCPPVRVAGMDKNSQVKFDIIDIDLDTLESIEVVPTQTPVQSRTEPDLSELEELIIAGTALSLKSSNSSVTPDNGVITGISDSIRFTDSLAKPCVLVTSDRADSNTTLHVCLPLSLRIVFKIIVHCNDC